MHCVHIGTMQTGTYWAYADNDDLDQSALPHSLVRAFIESMDTVAYIDDQQKG